MNTLLKQVWRTLQDFHMLGHGQTLLVAVSGGPDSVAMLHSLYRLREALDCTLIVAHLNHQMRHDAAEDARFVSRMADDHGLLCVCESRDVPAYQRQHRLSPEDAARQVRYAFLQATAARHGADHIAIGHTADDQAETVLLRLLRGTGLTGLVGIPPVQGSVIRPLIQVHRPDILTYLGAEQVPFREDPSNQHRRYTRNRLRLDVLPLLRQQYNPRLVESLCTMARLLAADEAALQTMAGECLRAVRLPGHHGEVRLHIAQLSNCLPALQGRVVRQALRQVSGGLHGFTQRHIAAVLALCATTSGSKRVTLPRQVIAERRYHVLHILRDAQAVLVAPTRHLLPIPGRCAIELLGLVVEGQVIGREALPAPFPTGQVTWLDASTVGSEVWVRTRRPGDRFQPLGCPHPKKLKTFLIDAKIPRQLRDRLALVVSERGIMWVAGVQIADWAKVTAATRQVLRLQVTQQAAEPAPTLGCLDGQTPDFPIVFQNGMC
jgi:tRNA(Ile)-lysidine synthase